MLGVPAAPGPPPPAPPGPAPQAPTFGSGNHQMQQRASTSVQLHPVVNRGSISSNGGAVADDHSNASNVNHHSHSAEHEDGKEGASSSGELRLLLDGKEANFADHLWDQFEVVYTRLTKGRHDLKNVKQYMEERAEAEQKYALALKKASEHPELEENCSLSQCWKDMRKSSTSFAKQHESLGVICQEIAGALEKTIVEIKTTKTKLMTHYKKVLADRETKKQHWEKCRKEYNERLKQAESSVSLKEQSRNRGEKELQKAEARVKSCMKDAENAHNAYKKAVDILSDSQKQYDTAIVDMMLQFERLERNRLASLSTQLSRWAQSHEFLRNAMDQIAVFIAKGITGINVVADINDFIKQKYSATKHPPYVQYEPIKSLIVERELKMGMINAPQLLAACSSPNAVAPGAQTTSINTSSSSSASASPPAPMPPMAPPMGGPGGPPMAPPAPSMNINVPAPPPMAAYPPSSSSSLFPPSSAAAPGHGKSPSSGGPPSGPPPAAARVQSATALYDFESTDGDDLPFKAGERIILLSTPETEDWWQGELRGKVGMFPKTYVERNQADEPAAPRAPPANPAPHFPPPAGGEDGVHRVGSGSMLGPGGDVPRLMSAVCAALFDFDGQDADELSFKAGQTLHITGELNGWYLGRVDNQQKIGIFPSNYVQLKN